MQLARSERSFDVDHAVIEAQHLLLVVPRRAFGLLPTALVARYAVAAQHRHALRQRGIVRQCHAAFAARDDLYWMKTKNGDVRPAAAADRLAMARGADGVGSGAHAHDRHPGAGLR